MDLPVDFKVEAESKIQNPKLWQSYGGNSLNLFDKDKIVIWTLTDGKA